MFRIKICGITNIDDALVAADAGADAIGFNFFRKSRRFIVPEAALEITAKLPPGVMKVGVFVNLQPSEITAIANRVGLDCIQLHGDEPPELLAALPRNLQVIRAHRFGQQAFAPLLSYLEECRAVGRSPDAVLIDADSGTEFGGTGRTADWEQIAAHRAELGALSLILAGGLTPQNVSEAIANVHPTAVDVASGVELQPGIKDHELVRRFVTAARQSFETK